MENTETIILSLGGSLIVPNSGIDTQFLKDFNNFIRQQLETTNRRFFIVCGGGATARNYQKAAREVIGAITDEDVDWLGIHTTRLNAHLIRTIFRDVAHLVLIEDYQREYHIGDKRVVIGAGWRPGCSTDYDCVLMAEKYNAKTVVNLSNVDMVYDKDPKEFTDAKPILQWSWKQYQTLAGDVWKPGMNVPFDPVASKHAALLNLTVIILNGKNLPNLGNALDGKEFVGTTIA